MRLYNLVAGGLPSKKTKDIPKEIREGMKAIGRVEAGIVPRSVVKASVAMTREPNKLRSQLVC